MANLDATPDKGDIPVPTEQELQRLKQNSDQAMISQQEIEQAHSPNADEAAKAQGHTPLPTGQREDENPADTNADSNDDLLRSDMVNAGD